MKFADLMNYGPNFRVAHINYDRVESSEERVDPNRLKSYLLDLSPPIKEEWSEPMEQWALKYNWAVYWGRMRIAVIYKAFGPYRLIPSEWKPQLIGGSGSFNSLLPPPIAFAMTMAVPGTLQYMADNPFKPSIPGHFGPGFKTSALKDDN